MEGLKIGPVHGLGVVEAAGIAGGLVDAAYFLTRAVLEHRPPLKVFQSIAAFWMGKASLDGGWLSITLGAATHFGLATIMAAVFFLLAIVLPVLRVRPIVSGAVYGLALYGVMYFVVLPSRWPTIYPRFTGLADTPDVLVHVAVGLAIALVISKSFPQR